MAQEPNGLAAFFPTGVQAPTFPSNGNDPRKFTSPDRALQGFNSMPFGSTASDLYASLNAPGDSSTQDLNGIRFICDDPLAAELVALLRQTLTALPQPGKFENAYLDSTVFVSGDPDFDPNVAPGDMEVCLLIKLDAEKQTAEPGVDLDILAGRKWRQLLQACLATPADANASKYLDLFVQAFPEDSLNLLSQDGALRGLGFSEAVGFLQFIQAVNISLSPLASIARLAGSPILTSPLVDSYCATFDRSLSQAVEQEISAKEYTPLDLFAQQVILLADLQSSSGWFLGSLPIFGFAAVFFLGELAGLIDASEVVKLSNAMIEFKTALAEKLASQPNLSKIAAGFQADLDKYGQELKDLVVGGTVVGGVAFIVGTIYQVIYDIINAFVQLIIYAAQGVGYLYDLAWKKLHTPPGAPLVPASPEVVSSWFADFDVKGFINHDLPAMRDGLAAFVRSLMDDFIANAREYGAMTGDYIAGGLSGALGFSIETLFEKYDPNASVLERIAYVVRQYFNLGTALGPVLVDIILFFCSGGESTVLSAAVKLSKTEEVAAAFRFVQRGAEAIRALAHYEQITARLKGFTRLIELIQGLFERLWNAVGPAVWQVTDWIKAACEAMPSGGKKVDVEKIVKMVEHWYERCSTLNFFVGIMLLLIGTSEIDENGNVGVAT